ncbi:3-deoxy-D-manno-octulosonic acid kinase [Pelistega ratti]|uniref:3-deoxy-D-manno-octulosonic acid kinase n=1 Tax=Pelistega ratti TaxID=2652177 RepID=UPI00135BA53D|nr:3-deoxy-D-manno-octulosonic acid kinase [Pelistega ratti]
MSLVANKDKRIRCVVPQWQSIIDEHFFLFNQAIDQLNPSIDTPYQSIQAVSSGGRNAAWYVEHPLFSGVLRQYRRGGLLGKIIHQRYVWKNALETRSWAEFDMMQYLYTQSFPVPRPVAAMYKRYACFYEAALITERIEGARTLVEVIKTLSPSEHVDYATKVATVIKQMHCLLVNHADLNAFNILVDNKGKIYIIDFDKSRRETTQGKWCEANLDRLERHLKKVLGELGFAFMTHIRQKY